MNRSEKIPDKENCIGSMAVSTAGRDRHRCFMITGICDEQSGTVYICDGKLRRLESPKRKKLRHIKIIECSNSERRDMILSGSLTNNSLYRYLSEYEKNRTSSADRNYESADI